MRKLRLCSLDYCFVTIMACNLKGRTRKTFNKEELVPHSREFVFCQEQLTKDGEQVTVFPASAKYLCHQHRTDPLSRIVQQLLGWSRYIHRLWRYFLE